MWQACLLLNLFFFFPPPQTVAYSCCWHVSPVRALCSSWGWERPAPPVSMLSALPAVTPAPCAAQPCRRRLWRSSAATPTATGCCSGRAVSPLNAWSFVWSAARSAIAVSSCLRNSGIYCPLVVKPNARKLWNLSLKWSASLGVLSLGLSCSAPLNFLSQRSETFLLHVHLSKLCFK